MSTSEKREDCMNRRSWYSLGLAALIVLVALALVGCGDSGNLPSAGSNQTGTTTAAGIQQFTQGTVDFGASDAPMKDEEIATAEQQGGAKVLHIPTVFGAVTLAYN